GVAVGSLRELFREARLPRFLPRLHAALLPRLLGVLERDVELHFLDARRRGHSRAERDPRRAVLGARLLRSFGFAGPDDDARRRAFPAEPRGIPALDLGFALLALVRPDLLQARRGRVDLGELGREIGGQSIPVASA